MKGIYIVALGLVMALVLCGTASAASSLEGPTGIANVPDTAVADVGKYEIALAWQDLDEPNTGFNNRLAARVIYGIAPKWEVGAIYNKAKDSGDAKAWGANVKYQVMREPESQYGLALGLGYTSASLDSPLLPVGAPRAAQGGLGEDGKWIRYYAVASKKLSMVEMGEVTGLIGIVGDKLDPDVGDGETDTNLMLGLEAVTRDGTWLGVEWRDKWKDEDKAIWSIVARRQLAKNVSAELGFTNSLGPIGVDDRKVFVGVSWGFGTPKEGY